MHHWNWFTQDHLDYCQRKERSLRLRHESSQELVSRMTCRLAQKGLRLPVGRAKLVRAQVPYILIYTVFKRHRIWSNL